MTDHGEHMPYRDVNEDNNYMDVSTSAKYMAQHEQFILMQDMVCDAVSQPQTFEPPNSNNTEEPPNEDT